MDNNKTVAIGTIIITIFIGLFLISISNSMGMTNEGIGNYIGVLNSQYELNLYELETIQIGTVDDKTTKNDPLFDNYFIIIENNAGGKYSVEKEYEEFIEYAIGDPIYETRKKFYDVIIEDKEKVIENEEIRYKLTLNHEIDGEILISVNEEYGKEYKIGDLFKGANGLKIINYK